MQDKTETRWDEMLNAAKLVAFNFEPTYADSDGISRERKDDEEEKNDRK